MSPMSLISLKRAVKSLFILPPQNLVEQPAIHPKYTSWKSAFVGSNTLQWGILHTDPQGPVSSLSGMYLSRHFLIIKRSFSSQQNYGTGGLNKIQCWRWHSGKAVVLGGDTRADSPEHCAKYGSYTMMNLDDNKVVVDIHLVQEHQASLLLSSRIRWFDFVWHLS